MKVNIGPYIRYWGPYQIVDSLFFWQEKYPDEVLSQRWDYKLNDAMGTWLAASLVNTACEWVESKRKRKVDIRIDRYDVWSMDHTLAMIVLPMLQKLKSSKHGSGMIELEDVPEYMRTTNTEEYEDQRTFKFYEVQVPPTNAPDIHTRYEWALDEMIWAFEQLNVDDWQKQYWSVDPVMDFTKYQEDEGKSVTPLRWKVDGVCDHEGMKNHQARIDNGLRLFGKYFQTLWD